MTEADIAWESSCSLCLRSLSMTTSFSYMGITRDRVSVFSADTISWTMCGRYKKQCMSTSTLTWVLPNVKCAISLCLPCLRNVSIACNRVSKADRREKYCLPGIVQEHDQSWERSKTIEYQHPSIVPQSEEVKGDHPIHHFHFQPLLYSQSPLGADQMHGKPLPIFAQMQLCCLSMLPNTQHCLSALVRLELLGQCDWCQGWSVGGRWGV